MIFGNGGLLEREENFLIKSKADKHLLQTSSKNGLGAMSVMQTALMRKVIPASFFPPRFDKVRLTHHLEYESVQFSCSVVSDSLRPHGLQHTRPPCPSPTPGVYSNSCSLSWWCHPTISSSVVPFTSCLQSFPASGSFQMSQLFASGGQSTGVSASASVLPMNIQDWSPLEWTGWISLQSKGLSRVFSNTTVQKHQFFSAQLSSQSNSHIHTWLVGKVMSLLFNKLSTHCFNIS